MGFVEFDKATETIGTVFTKCVINYNATLYPMVQQGIIDLYQAKLGITTTAGFLAMTTKFIKSGSYYYTTLYGNSVQGILIKTLDFITYELISIMDANYTFSFAENAISFLDSDNIVALSRTSNSLLKAKYTISTDSWSVWEIVTPFIGKPLLINYNGNIFAFYNVNSERTKMAISIIDTNGNLTLLKVIEYKNGIHYFDYIDNNGDLYFAFSNDKKKIGNSYHRSTISFLPIDL